MITLFVGAQWGDEGKGKVVDVHSEAADGVVRYNGGANAGHTLVIGGEKIVLHLLPVGIVRKDKWALVGKRVAIDLEVLLAELAIAAKYGSTVWCDAEAPIVLPIHKAIDAGRERSAGGEALGTTLRGIGPCYEDLTSRRSVRLGDLTSADRISAALKRGNYYAERQGAAAAHGMETMSLDDTVAWCRQFADTVTPVLADTDAYLRGKMAIFNRVDVEGAQGILLDPTLGTYPHCTSSPCGPSGFTGSFGHHSHMRVVGVAKAYVTRVGGGPFPTELPEAEAERLRGLGKEFGATTGRPRRCGWLDLRLLRYACERGGIQSLALTKLDVLFGPDGYDTIPVCHDYELGGRPLDPNATLTSDVLQRCTPVYQELRGDKTDITGCRKRKDLPAAVETYIRMIEMAVRVQVKWISVGPDREQSIAC